MQMDGEILEAHLLQAAVVAAAVEELIKQERMALLVSLALVVKVVMVQDIVLLVLPHTMLVVAVDLTVVLHRLVVLVD